MRSSGPEIEINTAPRKRLVCSAGKQRLSVHINSDTGSFLAVKVGTYVGTMMNACV